MNEPLPLAHVGILVEDVDLARSRWMTVLDFPFSPISRYQPDVWSDLVTPEPHPQSARLTFCFGDMPSFELLEFVGKGTHSKTRGEGGHHLSFPPISDLTARRDELAALGFVTDGSIEHDGRLIFMFADARPLDNVYTEWVEEHPAHADVKDDGSPVNRRHDGSKTLFELETIDAVDGIRPFSGVTEVEVGVRNLEKAVATWHGATGYTFPEPQRQAMSVVSQPVGRTAIRLCELDGIVHQACGVSAAVIEVDNLEATLTRLLAAEVPVSERINEDDSLHEITVAPAFLNNFAIRFRAKKP